MATTFKLDKLAAVNIILSNIGQAPLTSLNTSNPLSSLAEGMINEVSHSLQSEGWVFNTEQDYPFTPNNSKFIEIPDNVLSLDKTEWSDIEPVIRKPAGVTNARLYDKREILKSRYI